MTTHEIIDGLTNILNYCRYHENAPALREAIEMLKCSEIPNSSDERTDKRTGTHACDCIDRQAAIDAICKACSMEGDYHKCDGYPETSTWCDELVALRALPSAQPELIEKEAYIRGFEQGRTQGMIDSQGGKK